MNKKEKYGMGVIVVVVAPLKRDYQIDKESLQKIISNSIKAGVHGIFILGTTGEGTCFTLKEKEKIIKTAKRLTGNVTPLYAGVMDSSTNRVKENIKCAEENGADILVITPHYYLGSRHQDEIVRHFEACAEYARVPIMAYNIPQCTNINIALPTIERIIKIDNILGLKDSAGDWEQFQKEIFMKEKRNFKLVMGAEDLAGIAMLMGADGCVSAVANYAPRLLVEMYEKAKAGDVERVKELQRKAARLRTTCFAGDFWLAGLKYACSALGLCKEYISLPLQPLTSQQKLKIRNILKEEGLLN